MNTGTVAAGHIIPFRDPAARELQKLFRLLRLMGAHPDIIEHGERTAGYAVRLGQAVGLEPVELMDLHYAGLFHDIGKLTLPATLLEKRGPLTADEYALVQSHPRAGAELLGGISFLHRPAVWIAHHHERWDGSGYPFGLRDRFIPFGSRILAVADTFDALGSDPAEEAASPAVLLRLLAGSQLDPSLVELFLGQEQAGRGQVQGCGGRASRAARSHPLQ